MSSRKLNKSFHEKIFAKDKCNYFPQIFTDVRFKKTIDFRQNSLCD